MRIWTAVSFENSAEKVSQVCESFDRLQSRVSELNEGLHNATEELTRTWASYRERFESLDENLENVFGELNTGLDAFRGQVETFVQRVDSEMSRAVGMLSSAIQELATTTEDLTLALQEKNEPEPTPIGTAE